MDDFFSVRIRPLLESFVFSFYRLCDLSKMQGRRNV
jgi:hypothetical protein